MIKLFTDSAADMPREYFDRYGVSVIPFGISYGDEVYHTDFYDLRPDEFYRRCIEIDAWPKTSQPAAAQYEDKFRPALEEGHDVFCLCITSKFSGSYQSGVMAMNKLKEEFPERKILVMDSRRCTAQQGYLVYQACLMIEDGIDFDGLVSQMEAVRDGCFTFFSVGSLEYLRKGGRLGKASALLGSLLNIKPIISFTDAELKPHSKVRGTKNSIAEIVKALNKSAGEIKDKYTAMVFVSNMHEEGAVLFKELKASGFDPVHNWNIGPVVGAHLGPTGYAAGLLLKYEGQKVF
ncbi:MAG: DegV family protein [Defluviitaleaceae bacterium]|nr:DegV family protein [Defluviitaleaceae bacterium]MCL2835412.1 DegV family protein [Defluviitaleaceae bacterium]